MSDRDDLEARRAGLSDAKRALLAKKLGAGRAGAAATIKPREATREPPLSFAQERLWFLDQLDPGAVGYNVPGAIRLRGTLDADALIRSLDEIVARHEALRTVYSSEAGLPVARVEPAAPLAVTRIDLSDRASDQRESMLAEIASREARRPFDLTHGPMLRATLIRLEPDDHVLVLVMHHIASDGWSVAVIIGEVGALYSAFSAGKASPLPTLAIQYADFAAWQRTRLDAQTVAREIAFWRERLADAAPVLELPTDRKRPAKPSLSGAKVKVEFGPELLAAVKAFSATANVSLFMTLLAAFNALLQKYTGQDDLVVGTPVSGRNAPEIEGLIGLFINTIALRTRIPANASFTDLVAVVRDSTLDSLSHQDLPFEKIVAELRPTRDLATAPIFQVLFALQNVPAPVIRLGDLEVTLAEIDTGSAKFDLSLSLEETPNALEGYFEYSTDLFDRSTIERMGEHFAVLLRAIVEDASRAVSALSILGVRERATVVADWNATAAPFPHEHCVHDLFIEQARKTPDAIALEYDGQRLTYADLDLRSNQLAHQLHALGVGPETIVGACLERSLEMVTALLGILKAGGAYLPLDPEYPRDRLAFMLEDADVGVVLTQRHLRETLPSHRARVLCLDSDWAGIAAQPSTAPMSRVRPENLAYAIYTSGSTGRPKGALNAHRAVCNRLHWMQAEYRLTSDDRVLQKTPFSFDVSVWEFFWPLITGATLVMAMPGGHKDPGYLAETIQRAQITTLHFVPSMLAAFLEERGLERCKSVRRVICSGEALSRELVERFFARMTGELHNLYGPTECAVDVTAWPCSRGTADTAVPIGRPIANVQMYVLDAGFGPVPIGVPGELYIGGVGVGRGYLKRPDLTAEKFLPDPFSREKGARMYRTGDLARWRIDGTLEYLGRIDHQVKLRGFRIELGEVEAALAKQPGVREVAVVVREDVPGDKRMVAYLSGPGPIAPVSELRVQLRESLPEYMVPSAFVSLESMPLTASGKLDRNALPAPDAAVRTTEHIEPDGEDETFIARIFGETLGTERVGANDDFFVLGGHSLLATQVVSRIRSASGLEVPLRALFEAPTVREFAERVRGAREQSAGGAVAIPRRARDEGAIPLSFAQERLWFLDQLDPGSSAYNIASTLRLVGALDGDALANSLQAVVSRHEALRTRFVMVDGRAAQQIVPGVELAVTREDVRGMPADQQRLRLEQLARDTDRPFDLSQVPLFRAAVARLSDDEYVLFLSMHHIVSDGWSLGVLVRETAAFYEAQTKGSPVSLPELPVQYADFAQWQREWLDATRLGKQVEYWTDRLADAPSALELPTDRVRPPASTHRGASVSWMVPAALTTQLEALSRKHGVTLFMTLLGAFSTLLHRYSGQADIVVGTPIANRTRAETEGLIGFFVNTLALRTDFSDDPSFVRLLERVRETTLGAYSHQDLPFEKLVEALHTTRDLSRSPVFQVMFVLQNNPMPALRLGEVEAAIEATASVTSKFDLTLTLESHSDGLAGSFEYSTDLFDRSTIERMAGHFTTLLRAIVENAARAVSALPILGEHERETVVRTWNATGTDYARTGPLTQFFARQVERTPDALALIDGSRRWTYAELDSQSNRVGQHLRASGVGHGQIVGVCMDRCGEMVIALLGVLKSGAAYVPLDPAYPSERIAFMLQDAQAAALLTQRHLQGTLRANGANVVCLDAGSPWLGTGSIESLPPPGENELAYVIYTSGSTGRPKGVAIEHRSVVVFLQWVRDTFTREEMAGVLAATSICFDLSIFELFGTLSWGGTVILAENALALPNLASRGSVTMVNTVPSAMAELVSSGSVPASVSVVNLAGEALPLSLVQRIYAGTSARAVWNLYGPTEDTTYSTYARIERDAKRAPVIGRPLPDSRIYILNARMEPSPIGVPGELYIAGEGLARGYLGRPELTAERFIPDPFSSEPGARLYRTGDLARYLVDGNLEYLGRIDQQVKVRGFRIELGEIETALSKQPGVRDVAVLVREDVPGDKRIVAYVAGPGPIAEASELRTRLRESLPEFMLPSAFVVLGAMPLTPNGKLDRKALPAPDVTDSQTRTGERIEPRTPVEQAVAATWSEVLRVPDLGVADDFFALGGHSLLAAQVVSRLRARLGLEVPLRTLFEHSTVEGFATALAQIPARTDAAAPIRVIARTSAPPLSLGQERLWVIDQLEPGSPAFNLGGAVHFEGALDAVVLERALREVWRRHEALRTTFPSTDGRPEQRIATAAEFALAITDLAHLEPGAREIEAQRLAREENLRAFDLARGPLARARLLRLDAGSHVLMITMHHIISDGWSMNVLVREIAALYPAFAAGQVSPLQELSVQYADYAHWQREWLASPGFEQQLAYWKRQLAGAPPVLELPVDRARPPVQSYRGGQVTGQIPRALTDVLRGLGRTESASLFMVLLAAFEILLQRQTAQDDVVVGVATANRDRAEVEPLIGFFVDTLVMRTDLSGAPTFRGLLARVRDVALAAQEHAGVPFAKLLEALRTERNLSHTPLFQVLFNMFSPSDDAFVLPGLRVRTTGEMPGAKFDLTVYAEDRADGAWFHFVYNADVFAEARMADLLAQYIALLEQAAAVPDGPIGSYDLVTRASRAVLPDPTAPLDPVWHGAVPEVFAAHARRAPDRLAVTDPHERWTYGELDARTNRIARFLRTRGVGKGHVVAVWAHRSAPVVHAIIGILKAGATYEMLDPAYPPPRLIDYLDVAPPRALVQIAAAGPLPPAVEAHLAAIGCDCRLVLARRDEIRDDDPLAAESSAAVEVALGPDDVAVVTFTSGSTGKPKGVRGRHGPLSHFVPWQIEAFGFTADDRFSMLSGIAHDPLQRDIFTPLQLGASVHAPDPADIGTPGRLPDWMAHEGVTVVHLTPAMGQILTETAGGDEDDGRRVPTLRSAFLVGDKLTVRDVVRLRRLAPGVTCVNYYGSTETQRSVGYYVVDNRRVPIDGVVPSGVEPLKEMLPLGRGIKDVQLLVLGAAGQLAGVGEAGELYLRSPHLAAGYLGDPALTAQRFLPNPFTRIASDRLYRTGDLGRYLPDGNAEFIGRADHQVKIRGFRIELAEIEGALAQHPAVREVALLVREDVPGDRQLVAYVVATPGQTVVVAELRAHVSQRLPDYMVPAAVVTLAALPMTPNGKLDRPALPAPDRDARALGVHEAPASDTEQVVARVVAEVLGLAAVSVTDNFFDLGGNSLSIVRVCSVLRRELKLDLAVTVLFQHPTVRALARHLNEAGSSGPRGEDERNTPEWAERRRQAMRRQRNKGPR